jgi:hypothetical protein
MGWMFCQRKKGTSIKSFFQERFDFENDTKKGEIIDCKVVKLRTAYIAYKITDKENNTFKVVAVVCLLHYRKGHWGSSEMGYKDMDESMHPYYYDCPLSILSKLTTTDNENAISWREKCMENKKKKALAYSGSRI